MAMIYDFPTNYEEKIDQATKLMEKGYIDQAICLLEDFLEVVKDQKIEIEVKKQLITAYMLKGEFEMCEALILEIKAANCLDLIVAAHDILVTMFQLPGDVVETKQLEYGRELGLNVLTNKNLIELVYQLKTYYESYWYETIDKKIQVLKNESSFETRLMVLSDLQAIDPIQLTLFQEEFESILNNCSQPIIKTMLFELLVQKGIECEVNFDSEMMSRQLKTTADSLDEFYEQLNQAIHLLFEIEVDEDTRQLLKQHLIFFYQCLFPFVDEVNPGEVVQELARMLFGIELELVRQQKGLDDKLNTMTDITYKMSQYILSLSSLM